MAAAYAALVSLFNDLELIQNHPRHSFSFDNNQIKSLLKSVTFLIEFMESYDNNCHAPSKEAAQLLERRTARAAQAAEEVIGTHVADQIRSGSTLDGEKRSPRFLLDVEKVIHDMDYVRRKAIKIQQARTGVVQVRKPAHFTPASSSSSTALTSEKTTMVGFDGLLLQLLDLLTGYPSSRRVISIIGTGGIGKTTLAITAFENPLILQHFDVCLWATISQQYVVRDILLTLLSRERGSTRETVGELGEKLHKRLYGRRYLIVLDDMWSVEAWDEMKFFFPNTNNGSRMVVTTRQSYVGYHLGSSCLAVSLLDDDKSWDLFCLKVFLEQGCPHDLEDVGKNIVRKCKGLPLAIVVVAGHLGKSSRTQDYWESVANNIDSILNSEENKEFMSILSFSYSYLPIHLKPCFIYMGTFTKDREIHAPDLIKRWIAYGFLKPCKAKSLEEIGEDYVKDLIDRNLITGYNREEGKLHSYCKIHDLLRELCLRVAEKEMFFYVVHHPRADYFELSICREHRVGNKGSLPLDHNYVLESRTNKLSFDLRLCRALHRYVGALIDVDGGFLEVDLQHVNLRYLRYSYEYRSPLVGQSCLLLSPISIFWNLQTLVIAKFNLSIVAPSEIWEMVQLRHLEVSSGIHLPDPLQENELVMQNLHTLLVVENFKFIEEVCRRVPNINALEVRYFDYWRKCDETRSYYCPHNLGCLHKLETLELNLLDGSRDSGWREFSLSLTFPSSLKKLSLRNTFLDWDEMTMMVGSLPHLESLSMGSNAAIGSEWTLVERKFLHLKSLAIHYIDDLVYWNADSSHFPVLEDIDLHCMSRLDEVPSDMGNIPTLRSISLWRCSLSSNISAVRMVVEQEEEQEIEGLTLRIVLLSKDLESFNRKVEDEGLMSNNVIVNNMPLHMNTR